MCVCVLCSIHSSMYNFVDGSVQVQHVLFVRGWVFFVVVVVFVVGHCLSVCFLCFCFYFFVLHVCIQVCVCVCVCARALFNSFKHVTRSHTQHTHSLTHSHLRALSCTYAHACVHYRNIGARTYTRVLSHTHNFVNGSVQVQHVLFGQQHACHGGEGLGHRTRRIPGSWMARQYTGVCNKSGVKFETV